MDPSNRSLSAQIRDLTGDALGTLMPGPGRDMVEQIQAKLSTPLTVTVAGGVSSGKSTLVNALLGQRIAAVDAGECTRVVTEFRFGVQERAEVMGTDGSTTVLSLDRGRVPEHLGRPAEQIISVVVHLSNELLRELAVVDTPGLNTVTEANEDTTANFLGVTGREGEQTADAVGRADALVFLLPMLRQADAEVLRGFSKLFGGSGLSAASSIAVLSKIDRLDRSADPMRAAQPIADRMAVELRGVVSAVVPVMGLLAETCHAAVFTEADARALVAVAAVDDEFDREDMLLSAEDFLRTDVLDLEVAQRRRLLSMLDIHGIAVAIAAVDQGATTAGGILQHLAAHSGFDRLRSAVLDRFAGQSDLFKAHAALCDLRRASYLRTDPDNARTLRSLRSPLERIELDPAMHRLRLLEVAHAVAAGELILPADLLDDVVGLTSPDDPRSTVSAIRSRSQEVATAGASRWGNWGNDARRSPDESRLARIVKEAYEVMWNEFVAGER
jgi:Ni2+-binding GTPase involved in maturation of urease and hydrogenase